jgi:hypothetical protein
MATTTLRRQVVSYAARVAFIGLVATGAIGGGIRLGEFNSAGAPSTTTYVARDFLNVFVSGTGGNVKSNNYAAVAGAKYDAVLVANPLAAIGGGSGVITNIRLEVASNPASASFDCGFVKAANAGTGTEIFPGGLVWNGADYIKCGSLTNPTSSFSGRLRIEYSDLFSE